MNICILLRHSGIWERDVCYSRYKSDGLVVGQTISYANLKTAIAAELDVDELKKNIEIRYIIEGNSSPMIIRNDMGVRLYLELKKNEPEVCKHPLCIDVSNKNFEVTDEFYVSAGENLCVEGSRQDTQALAVVELGNGDSCYIPGIETNNYITDTSKTDVKEKQMYKNKATLVSVMVKYKVENNFNFKVKRSDTKSYILVCLSDDCAWTMKAFCRNKSDVFKIRYFNSQHSCPVRDRMLSKVQATIGLVSGITVPKLVNHKRVHTPKDVIEDVKSIYGVEISYQQAWRAKERAVEMIRGKPVDGYSQMPRYIYMLNLMYPNSYIRMHKSEKNEFMYLFIALRPFMRAFDFCRPVVVVDGAHLSGTYKGTFVSASTLDGAGCILPLAYGVVDTENDCSWTWFFEQFKNAFGEREKMCVVSDRNESIMKSVSSVFPNVPHYACIWHLWKNVCGNFKRSRTALSDIFYSMAKAYRKEDFDTLMDKVEKIDHRVKDYLKIVGYEKWSKVHAPINRGRMMTSNIAECINGCLVEARQLPIIDFLEEARILFGTWHCKNREISSYTRETLGRRFEEILIVNASKCSRMKVVPSSEFMFSVYEDGRRYVVCLERKVCNCGRFQYDEIPCLHAIAVLKTNNVVDMHPYCSDYYKPETLAKTYEVSMAPMPDKADWLVPEHILKEEVFPPKYKRMPGRPRKRRKKKSDEKITSNTNYCGRCGQEGHNRRTCTFFPKEK